MRTKGIKGAAAELIVAAELMRKGYDVYRALSPSAPCDLIATLEDVVTRIEVRTVTERVDGSLVMQTKEYDRCDMYAFVCGNRIEFMTPDQVHEAKRFHRDDHEPLSEEKRKVMSAQSVERWERWADSQSRAKASTKAKGKSTKAVAKRGPGRPKGSGKKSKV